MHITMLLDECSKAFAAVLRASDVVVEEYAMVLDASSNDFTNTFVESAAVLNAFEESAMIVEDSAAVLDACAIVDRASLT
jgi:hypothetical protein